MLNYTRLISDEECKCLEHFVPDVQAWIEEAISNKIENCKKRILRQEIEESLNNNRPIPTTASDVLAQVFSRQDYKNRQQRIEDDEKKDETPVEGPIESVPLEENG